MSGANMRTNKGLSSWATRSEGMSQSPSLRSMSLACSQVGFGRGGADLHLVLEAGEHLEEDCPEGDEGGEEDKESVSAEQRRHLVHKEWVVLLLGWLQPRCGDGLGPPAATAALHTCGADLHCNVLYCTVL